MTVVGQWQLALYFQVRRLPVLLQRHITHWASSTSYSHKKLFEDRVPQQTIVAFRNCAFGNAREQENSFYYLWKQYLKKSGGSKDSAEAEKEQLDLFKSMMGYDNNDNGLAAGGKAA